MSSRAWVPEANINTPNPSKPIAVALHQRGEGVWRSSSAVAAPVSRGALPMAITVPTATPVLATPAKKNG